MKSIKPITFGQLKEFINSLDLKDNAPVISVDLNYEDERASVQLEFSQEVFNDLDSFGEENGNKTEGLLITFTSFKED